MIDATSGRKILLLSLAAGFGLWAVAFVALYAMLSIGCAFGWDRGSLVLGLSLQRLQLLLLLGIFLALHVALVVGLSARQQRSDTATDRFLHSAARLAAIAALAASMFTYCGTVLLTTCNP
ncbi:hypothetical protein IMF23_07435 [Chelatococcus daeguensis]|uniref:Uncharacterized protein n=2 Tax=Chelatococcus TaxID=28209 RepID=A0AAC9JSQ1_9HYPH|nr:MULTISPECIES: hypothetical protein [Chelatococcus]APF38551.1 hypothetical protein BOQ54_15520 [Chelatococcus daeguensis]KZE34421.1 hypothetical protein AVW15_01790 [Chelatococcus daeguensis]MBM3083265.1 hypothetical protein [Chelatococcus daeguensis]CUA89847.1 hypothetical protein Ga0061061_11028 [Chelatococcus sambhunathii]